MLWFNEIPWASGVIELKNIGFCIGVNLATTAWHEGEQSIKEEDPLGHRRVMDAVDQQMSAKGFKKVSSSPDVYITYTGEDNEQIRMDTTHKVVADMFKRYAPM